MRRPTPVRPGPGQESVWEYPRPPGVEPSDELVEIVLGGVVIATTTRSLRVLETSHPPTYYLPAASFRDGVLVPAAGSTWCEFKGRAAYVDLHSGVIAARAGWTYPDPTRAYRALLDHVAVMPGRVDRCMVDGEVVGCQEGHVYGGWITSRVVGPFKGGPGTSGW